MQIKKGLHKLLKSNLTPRSLKGLVFLEKYLKQKGWFKSWSLHKPVDGKGNPIPWFTYPSIYFIEQKLNLKPMKVFEFGSGNSTMWFSSKVNEIISIENDVDFYNQMLKKIESLKNVSYELRSENDGYNQRILDFKNEFDIIIIDGIERIKCTKNCIDALKEDGVIIFDNSDRTEYQEAYDYLLAQGFKKIDFKGIGPLVLFEWQTSIYYRNKNCFEI